MKSEELDNEYDFSEQIEDTSELEEIREHAKFKIKQKSVISWKDQRFDKFRSKVEYSFGDVKSGFLIKGEQKDKIKELYCPFYFQLKKSSWQLITGCYRLRWGQGLLHAKSYRVGSKRDAGAIVIRNSELVMPNLGSYENLNQRGAAVSYSYQGILATAFFSETEVGVNYQDSLTISSFTAEIGENSKTAMENLSGIAFSYARGKLASGLLVEKMHFSRKFTHHSDWHNQILCSGWIEYRADNLEIGSEIANSSGSGAGIIYSSYGNTQIKQYLYLRSYGEGFSDVHGNPYSRKSSLESQEGIYYGIKLNPGSRLKLNIYSDLYTFTSSRYLVDLPSGGSEQMLSIIYGSEDNYLELNGKYRNSEQYHAFEDSSKVVDEKVKQLQCSLNQAFDRFELRSRIHYREEYLPEPQEYQHGIYFYQQIRYKMNSAWIWFRLTAFKTSLPLYLYENNVSYSHKQICLGEDGYRFAILANQTWKGINFELKYAWEKRKDQKKASLYMGIRYSRT